MTGAGRRTRRVHVHLALLCSVRLDRHTVLAPRLRNGAERAVLDTLLWIASTVPVHRRTTKSSSPSSTARDAVTHRQHRHGRFKTRPKHAACDIRGQLRTRPLSTARAAYPRAARLESPALR